MKKKESQLETDKIKQLIGIELPQGDYELLKEEDKEAVRSRYESSKDKTKELIQTFYEKGYRSGAAYLENLSVIHSYRVVAQDGSHCPEDHLLAGEGFSRDWSSP